MYVCMHVCVYEREIERERESVCVCVRVRACACACACVCVVYVNSVQPAARPVDAMHVTYFRPPVWDSG